MKKFLTMRRDFLKKGLNAKKRSLILSKPNYSEGKKKKMERF